MLIDIRVEGNQNDLFALMVYKFVAVEFEMLWDFHIRELKVKNPWVWVEWEENAKLQFWDRLKQTVNSLDG